MRAPDWLTARPVAHRGLHDISRGIVENMPGAVAAAIAGNFAIEVDIQLAADGEAMVHHDDALGRLTEGSGALLQKTAAELKAVRFKDTPERMMSLADLCSLVAGRVPLVIEMKSHFDGDRRLVARLVLGSHPIALSVRIESSVTMSERDCFKGSKDSSRKAEQGRSDPLSARSTRSEKQRP